MARMKIWQSKAGEPLSAFDQDLLNSFNSLLTVSNPRAENAEERITAVIQGRERPTPGSGEEEEEAATGLQDLEENAIDQIREHIGRRFKGHDLSRLVFEILQAQGYQAQMSPAGPDGGMDIIAGRGPMGFDAPRLCVQVKSSDSPIDVNVLRSLQGVMGNFGAQQGLLVSWGGFKQSVVREARRLYFEVRLWDAGKVVSALFENYDKLSEEIRTDLPLKRIWVLVPEEE